MDTSKLGRIGQAAERRGKDRRTGKMDELFRQLLARGAVTDRRKGNRRSKKEREEIYTKAHDYVDYVETLQSINRKRENEGLTPVPIPEFYDWIERIREKETPGK